MFLSISLPLSLPLSYYSCGCVRPWVLQLQYLQCAEKCVALRPCLVSLLLWYFLLSDIHVKALNGCSISAACTLSMYSKLCVFVFAPSLFTGTQSHIVRMTTFSLTASLVCLSDSKVIKSSLEVGCVCLSVFVLKERDQRF